METFEIKVQVLSYYAYDMVNQNIIAMVEKVFVLSRQVGKIQAVHAKCIQVISQSQKMYSCVPLTKMNGKAGFHA